MMWILLDLSCHLLSKRAQRIICLPYGFPLDMNKERRFVGW
jgi:hypothetical protein